MMSVQIIINGESAAESLKELSVLAAGFNAPATAAVEVKQEEAPKRTRSKTETPKQSAKEEQAESSADDAAIDQEKEEGGEEIPTDKELRAAATEKSKAVGKAKVKALLDKYEVPNVTALPNDQRATFLEELEGLE